MNGLLYSILLVLVGTFLGTIIIIVLNYIRGIKVSEQADKLLSEASLEANKLKRDSILEAKEEIHTIKVENDKEIKEKKSEMKAAEARLLTREDNIDRRDQTLQNREQLLEEKENNIIKKQREIQKEQDKVEELKKEQMTQLEKIAG